MQPKSLFYSVTAVGVCNPPKPECLFSSAAGGKQWELYLEKQCCLQQPFEISGSVTFLLDAKPETLNPQTLNPKKV